MKFQSRMAFALAAFASVPVVAPALAADYDPPVYVDEAPEYKPVEIGSGWYLRGDLAYLPRGTYRNLDFDRRQSTIRNMRSRCSAASASATISMIISGRT